MRRRERIDKHSDISVQSDLFRAKSAYIRRTSVVFLASKNLFYRKLRTALTVGGVVIGIGAIVFLISFGIGLRNLVTKEVIGNETINLIDVTTPKPNTIKLTDEKLNNFEKLAHVSSVSKTFTFAGKISINKASADAVVYGTDASYRELLSMKYIEGNNKSIQNDNNVVVNTSFLQYLGVTKAKEALNKTFEVTIEREKPDESGSKYITQKLIVKGVVETGSGGEIYTTDALWANQGFTQYSQAKVVVNDNNAIYAVRKQIEASGYSTSSPVDTIAQINSVFSIFTVLLAGFGSIGLLVAVLGMFNTLTISLLERTKEIGLMSALGARQKDIRRIFYTESLMLSLAGGVGGVIGAFIIGLVLNMILSAVAKSKGVSGSISVFVLPWWIIVSAIVFCGSIGLLVALYPVYRSTKRSPIDALRFD